MNQTTSKQNILKWTITQDQTLFNQTAQLSINRIVTRAETEKKAKANGLWDYRNNKIVEA